MLANCRFVMNRFVAFALGCIFIIAVLQGCFIKLVEWVPSFSPLFFPTLTIFLLVFHLFIACFMAMKYWCDKKRLYLVPIASAFAGSALLMVGTLSSFPGWLDLYQFNEANYNDAMIFYMFRHHFIRFAFPPFHEAPTSVLLSDQRSLRAACFGWRGSIPAIPRR